MNNYHQNALEARTVIDLMLHSMWRQYMNVLETIRLRFRGLFQKQKLDAHMEHEVRSHFEMQPQENIDGGMNSEQARHAAKAVISKFAADLKVTLWAN